MNWTQPMCPTCWRQRHQERPPVSALDSDVQTCAFCGKPTSAGIFVRADPRTVPFPAQSDIMSDFDVRR